MNILVIVCSHSVDTGIEGSPISLEVFLNLSKKRLQNIGWLCAKVYLQQHNYISSLLIQPRYPLIN